MATKDDVRSDLEQRGALTRSEVEQVIELLGAAPAADSGMSIADSLRPLLTETADRLECAAGADVTDYVRILKHAMIASLQLEQNELAPAPTLEAVFAIVDNLED